MKKISIIVPVYNCGTWLKKCVDSIINQTYSNLEILLINDGSTDDSGVICDFFKKSDKRIKVFHKENGGVSSARNVGLDKLKGKYVCLVDSDDWLEPHYVETLYNAVKKYKTAMSICGYNKVDGGDVKEVFPKEDIFDRVLTQKEMLLYSFNSVHYTGFNFAAWNKMFTVDFLRRNNLRFDERYRSGNDAVFTVSTILTENCTGVYVKESLYNYFQRSSSLTYLDSLPLKLSRLDVFKRLVELSVERGYEELSIYMKVEYCYAASLLAQRALSEGENDSALLLRSRDAMRLYFDEYTKLNKDRNRPERIERIEQLDELINAKLQSNQESNQERTTNNE
ncbi:MAG: glycosyltransferase [Oscillospiraceae bacterium]|nr:glycosyltransferase [Oscillospiraceae bacterium]